MSIKRGCKKVLFTKNVQNLFAYCSTTAKFISFSMKCSSPALFIEYNLVENKLEIKNWYSGCYILYVKITNCPS